MTTELSYFPLLYAAPISWYASYLSQNSIIVLSEPFIKQTARNRAQIYGANGSINLAIPLKGATSKAPLNTIEIANTDSWQANHWKTLVSAYKSSPFFEYYSPILEPNYTKTHNNLSEFNLAIHTNIIQCLQVDTALNTTRAEIPFIENDNRHRYQKKKSFYPNSVFPTYQQVFSYDQPFLPNLSIYDLIFNLGPESNSYLTACAKNISNL